MNYFIVTFDRSPLGDYKQFHTEFVGHAAIKRWSHYIKPTYIVGTEDFTAKQLSEHFRKTALKYQLPTRHLVVEVNLHNRWGWLPKRAWKWINRQTAKVGQ